MRWIALEPSDLEANVRWDPAPYAFAHTTAEARTGEDGTFRFEAPPRPEMPAGSILVAVHPEHRVSALELGADRGTWPAPLVLRLGDAEVVSVRVVDEAGRPQVGATVHHGPIGRAPDLVAGTRVRLADRFLAQEALTDPAGRATLPVFEGEQELWAERGTVCSPHWRGRPRAEVELVLHPTFEVSGTVAYSNRVAWSKGYEGERRILVSSRAPSVERTLAVLRAVPEGAFGPIRVPLDGSPRYSVRFEGVPIQPQEETFPAPSPGARLRFDFVGEKRCELYLMAQNAEGETLLDAEAFAWWGPGQPYEGPSYVEGCARADGYLYLGTFPPGPLAYGVRAPGYALASGTVRVPVDSGILVELERAGGITGHCTHAGAPVADFEVVYRPEGTLPTPLRRRFVDRADGSFELDDLAAGDWTLYAASPAFPGGATHTVRVQTGAATSVELELPSALPGRGRVIAEDTGRALADARVQVYTSGGLERGFAWGPPLAVEADGSFAAEAFVRGANFITVSAAGYATSALRRNASGDEPLDWGEIRLQRPQTLELRLLGLEALEGTSVLDFVVASGRGQVLPEQRPTAEGRVRFEDVAPGDQDLVVNYPDGAFARLQLSLVPGADWSFDFRVAGAHDLDVELVDLDGNPLRDTSEAQYYVAVDANEESGHVYRVGIPSEGHAHFGGVSGQRVQVSALRDDAVDVATLDAAFTGEARLAVTLVVGGPPLRLHVVDGEGQPISGVLATVRSADGVQIHGVGTTDATGTAELYGLPERTLLLDLRHGVAGARFGLPMDASVREHEFELLARGGLELVLHDGGVPLEGVVTRLETLGGASYGSPQSTDAAGRTTYAPLGEGRYHLTCRRADAWEVSVDASLAADEHARREVEMRRLADLELGVLAANGARLAGAALGLHCVELDADVADWIRGGRVQAPLGLVTDGSGVLRLHGLPHGTYVWSLETPEGPAEGTFVLEPAVSNARTARLAH